MLMYKLSTAASYGADAIMILLIVASVFVIAFFIERYFYFKKNLLKDDSQLMADIKNAENRDMVADALKRHISKETDIILEGFANKTLTDSSFRNSVEGNMVLRTKEWERFSTFFAAVGSNAPFGGLLGTVLGLMKSFADIALSESLDARVAMSGISDALLTTVAGIMIAIPSIVFFNYCKNRIAASKNTIEGITLLILSKEFFGEIKNSQINKKLL